MHAPKWHPAPRSNGTKQSPEWHPGYVENFVLECPNNELERLEIRINKVSVKSYISNG